MRLSTSPSAVAALLATVTTVIGLTACGPNVTPSHVKATGCALQNPDPLPAGVVLPTRDVTAPAHGQMNGVFSGWDGFCNLIELKDHTIWGLLTTQPATTQDPPLVDPKVTMTFRAVTRRAIFFYDVTIEGVSGTFAMGRAR